MVHIQQQDASAMSATATVLTRRPSPLDIIELLTRILSYLDQSTLKSKAAHVSSQWFDVARTLIQRHLHLNNLNPDSWTNLRERLLEADMLTITGYHGGGPYIDGTKGWRRLSASLARDLSLIKSSNINNSVDAECKNTGRDIIAASGSTRQQRSSQQDLQIKELNMLLPHWFLPQDEILTYLNPSDSLRDLSIGVPASTPSVQLDMILEQCPHLLHLSLHRSYGYHDNTNSSTVLCFKSEMVQNTDSNSLGVINIATPCFPLLSFSVIGMHVPGRMMTHQLLPQLGNLKKLSLLHIRQPSDNDIEGLHRKKPRQQFWKSLSDHCPRLESISFCYAVQAGNLIPVRMFPRVRSWSIDSKSITPSDITWNGIVATSARNTLTGLKIMGDGFQDQNLERAAERARLLHRFLCDSPQLIHLEVSALTLPTSTLWGYENKEPEAWACRWLQTLTLSIGGQSSLYSSEKKQLSIKPAVGPTDDSVSATATSRQVFGYLSRVCPRLSELTLKVDCKLFSLESGLCILTRLECLERLDIRTDFGVSDAARYIGREDFAWIQNLDNKVSEVDQAVYAKMMSQLPVPPALPPRTPQLPRLPVSRSLRHALSLVPSLQGINDRYYAAEDAPPSSSPEKVRPAPEPTIKDAVEEVDACLKAVQELSNQNPKYALSGYKWGPWSQRSPTLPQRLKMQDQQVSNRYLSNYDREPPAMDGLQDWEFYGGLIDMEACLRAQLYRYQQHKQQLEEASSVSSNVIAATTIATSLAANNQEYSRPWPAMVALTLSYRNHASQLGASPSYQATRTQRILEALRPDINVLCTVVD
ncbi:hypothetical protein BGZ83_009039 [Gryganskiella cystojenkinii]|nr:hypothetical protein BGZ83_009039 [Gryganskiella cystojenkinii]